MSDENKKEDQSELMELNGEYDPFPVFVSGDRGMEMLHGDPPAMNEYASEIHLLCNLRLWQSDEFQIEAFDLTLPVTDAYYCPEKLREAVRALEDLLGVTASRVALVPLSGALSDSEACSVH